MQQQKDGFAGERALVLPDPLVLEFGQDPQLAALSITDIGHYPCARNHYRERTTPINQYILIYCTEGRGQFSLQGRSHTVSRNQFFILPPGIPHAYGADRQAPWTIYWIHFGGTMAPQYGNGLGVPCEVAPPAEADTNDRIDLFETIFRTLEWGYGNDNLHYASAVLHHLLASFRYARQFVGQRETSLQNDIVDTAILFMKRNIERKLTVGEIAAQVGYSPSHFVSLFSARTGQTPIACLNQLRIQMACRLLDQTHMKINQICHKVGIDDCFYFSRLFRKEMGISPTDYREQPKG